MPLYTWKSDSSGKEVDILRNFEDSLVPPTQEELDHMGIKEDVGPWKKIISRGIKVVRGDSWNGSKGNW
jgi:predicted nucleic acid-binding Zn ribbon protein